MFAQNPTKCSVAGKIIPNGAQGMVTAINDDNTCVTVDVERPAPMSGVQFHMQWSPVTMGPHGVQLKRYQMPLELACASTIHSAQGDTEKCVATCIDGSWMHTMWAREMLFTLITRVGHLEDLIFVGFRCAFPEKLNFAVTGTFAGSTYLARKRLGTSR